MKTALDQACVVGVIGAGAMGAGIAQVAATAGHPVVLFDIDAQAVERALTGIAAALTRLADKGRLSPDAAQAAIARIRAAVGLADLRDAGLVIEAVAERLDIKQKIFGDLEGIVGEQCILATNTSSISVTAIGASLRNPARLVGMHFFNPAPLMALVEVVSGLATSEEAAQRAHLTAAAWGKTPVHAKSTPGFIVNRVARPFYAEGLRVLTEQAADPASIDTVMRDAGQFRMGPFELMDLIGHDVNFAVTESVFRAYFYDRRFTPSLIQQELVSAGFLGRKTGRGFYDYAAQAAKPAATIEAPASAPRKIRLGKPEKPFMPLQERLSRSGLDVSTDADDDVAGLVAKIDDAVLLLTDGRTATRRACDIGRDNVVLVDLALDFATTKTLALTRALQCSDAAYLAVVGALQRSSYAVVPVADTAGMVLMRTVAMLVNEAADAVNQGVCTASDLDLAMKKGVNYPLGPLDWADSMGVELFYRALVNLAGHYGEDRYRVSPLLAAHHWAGKPLRGAAVPAIA